MEWLDIIIRTDVNDPNAELRLYKFVKTIRFTEIPKHVVNIRKKNVDFVFEGLCYQTNYCCAPTR